MAVFKYYNFQLLPIDTTKYGDVGAEGYQRVFVEIRKRVDVAKRTRSLQRVAGRLQNDFKFAPFQVRVLEKFAYGEFLKFDQVEKVENLYTGDDEFTGNEGSTSKKYDFYFAFDYERHTLAIQLARGLPSAGPLIDALTEIFRPIVDDLHPNHQLHIRELTSADSLVKVFNADRYRRVEVDVTFSNSEELEEELLRSAGVTEQDLKDNSVHSVTHIEKPAKKGSMTGLSSLAKPLLVIAANFGNANVSYATGDGDWEHYHMRDYPVKSEVDPAKDETHQNFMARVFSSITLAWRRTRVADEVNEELKKTKIGAGSDDGDQGLDTL